MIILIINYYIESIKTISKIDCDLMNKNVKFEIIKNLLSDENKENIFLNKIKLIDNDMSRGKKILEGLKQSLDECIKKLNPLEMIYNYYNQFYKESKKNQIKLIKHKLKELSEKNISEILNQNNFFNDNDTFIFNEAIDECKNNIKYSNSKIFMSIYNKNKNNRYKTEDEIFKLSIKNFRETITNIINRKEIKIRFLEIKFINEVLNTIRTYNNDNDLKNEVDFILKEFKHLEKEEYIKNDLLNDLIKYSNIDNILNIILGNINFIEIYSNIKNIELTKFSEQNNNIISKLDSEK